MGDEPYWTIDGPEFDPDPDDYDPEQIDGYCDTCELCGAEVEETQRYCHECGVDRLAYALQNVPEGF